MVSDTRRVPHPTHGGSLTGHTEGHRTHGGSLTGHREGGCPEVMSVTRPEVGGRLSGDTAGSERSVAMAERRGTKRGRSGGRAARGAGPGPGGRAGTGPGPGGRAGTGPGPGGRAGTGPGVTGTESVVPSPVCKGKWKNKERVLIFSSRGINYRTRHLMQDLRTLMPHSKPDTKMDRKDKLFVINEICEMKNCNKCVYFEAKKKQDLYMWISNVPQGPSAKFLIQNVHTLAEMKMTGNCLKGSRPLLSFDPTFDKEPHYSLLKELLIQIFSTPHYHPKSQPFVDHIFTFTITDDRIWFRNYQIIEEDGALVEIGPRFVLNLIKIFQGSFGGPTLYENPTYCSPNMHRRMLRIATAARFVEKHQMKELQRLGQKEERLTLPQDPTQAVFDTPTDDKSTHIQLQAPPEPPRNPNRKKRPFQRQRVKLQR